MCEKCENLKCQVLKAFGNTYMGNSIQDIINALCPEKTEKRLVELEEWRDTQKCFSGAMSRERDDMQRRLSALAAWYQVSMKAQGIATPPPEPKEEKKPRRMQRFHGKCPFGLNTPEVPSINMFGVCTHTGEHNEASDCKHHGCIPVEEKKLEGVQVGDLVRLYPNGDTGVVHHNDGRDAYVWWSLKLKGVHDLRSITVLDRAEIREGDKIQAKDFPAYSPTVSNDSANAERAKWRILYIPEGDPRLDVEKRVREWEEKP